jgi:hypothetical protein
MDALARILPRAVHFVKFGPVRPDVHAGKIATRTNELAAKPLSARVGPVCTLVPIGFGRTGLRNHFAHALGSRALTRDELAFPGTPGSSAQIDIGWEFLFMAGLCLHRRLCGGEWSGETDF